MLDGDSMKQMATGSLGLRLMRSGDNVFMNLA